MIAFIGTRFITILEVFHYEVENICDHSMSTMNDVADKYIVILERLTQVDASDYRNWNKKMNTRLRRYSTIKIQTVI